MARTALPTQSIAKNSSATLSYNAADSANGMYFNNDGKTRLICKNASAGSITMTVRSVAEPKYQRTGDLAVVIAAGAEAMVTDLAPEGFSQTGASVGQVNVDFSASTSVTVACVSQQ